MPGLWRRLRNPQTGRSVRSRAGGNPAHARALPKRLDRVLPWEVLDTYVSPSASADGLDPDTVANLEPRLRNLECDKPHKPGGQIAKVNGDPQKKGHILLFQLASDAATEWICGDLMSRSMLRT